MASSGKKGKKSKGTVISLQSFLADEAVPAGTTQVAKKIRNVHGEDSDDECSALPLVYQLPTAPRANRVFNDELLPHKPPYIAYITNLPFDVNEDDINEFFGSIPLTSIRLPREDGDTGRVRGFGYVEFESRDDLFEGLNLPDPSIKGRRIRIEISNENESYSNRQRTNRRGFESLSNGNECRESTNWRQDPSGFNNNLERAFTRERRAVQDDHKETGSWRIGTRPQAYDFSPKKDKIFESVEEHGGRLKSFERTGRQTSSEEILHERPKLHLKPRTLPLPDILTQTEDDCEEKKEVAAAVKQSGVSSEKVFGSAKPVDTAAREMEIEGRMQEARRQSRFTRETSQAEVNAKLSDIHLEKNEQENTNTAESWRRKNVSNIGKLESRKQNQDRKQVNQEKDLNRHKVCDQNARDNTKPKPERAMSNYKSEDLETTRHSSNKYFGLEDEATE